MIRASIFLLILMISRIGFCQSVEGVYVGLQELCFVDSSGNKDCEWDKSFPGYKWFHLTEIKLTNDSVYMDMSPVAIKGTDTLYSASEGGFYYRRGEFIDNDSVLQLNTSAYWCDYCPTVFLSDTLEEPIKIKTTAYKVDNGFVFDGNLFKKKEGMKSLISESNDYLDDMFYSNPKE